MRYQLFRTSVGVCTGGSNLQIEVGVPATKEVDMDKQNMGQGLIVT
jgi:hypothetical protein